MINGAYNWRVQLRIHSSSICRNLYEESHHQLFGCFSPWFPNRQLLTSPVPADGFLDRVNVPEPVGFVLILSQLYG